MTIHIVPDHRLRVSLRLARWLTTADRAGAFEAVLLAMTKKVKLPHWGSKGAVNRAGDAIRADNLTPGQTIILESWRMAHQRVIHTFEALLRTRAKNLPIEVAQRLKRRNTIVDKLMRFPRMELARMDDIAGCRLIFKSIEDIYEFRNKLHRAKFNHVLRNGDNKDKYDYIKSPSDRGYRGVHDIYEYRAKKGRDTSCNGLLIEIQYRTDVQHAWATAVEVITQITENEPKFNRGDQRYIRLFCLAGEMLARVHEGMTGRIPALSNADLISEFDKLDNEIMVMSLLTSLMVHKWASEKAKAAHVILQLSKDGGLKTHNYDLELEASKALLELEKTYPDDNIVLVGAKTAAEIASAFRNYFNDVGDFLSLMHKAHKMLGSTQETKNETASTKQQRQA